MVNMLGSISLLLWGSFTVRAAVEGGFSGTLKTLLCKAASSRPASVTVGALAALTMQSATATALLCCGFVSSGTMSSTAAITAILGADLGSALAARILFLNLSFLPALFLLIGLALHLSANSWKIKTGGRILIGLGIMLLSIQWMKQTVTPIADAGISEDWLSVMQSTPLIAFVFAAVITWFAHSSVAIVLVIASLAQTGLVDSQLSITMLLGANVGAGFIPLPLVSRSELRARSTVLCNLILRSVATLCLIFTLQWWFVPPLTGQLEPGVEIVTLHILFNLLLVILFTPFATFVSDRIFAWLEQQAAQQSSLYINTAGAGLDINLITKPGEALAAAKREALRLGDLTENMFSEALNMFSAEDKSEIYLLTESDKELNSRNKAIHSYLSRLRQSLNNINQEKELDKILQFSSTMENIGDTVSHNLARLAHKKIGRNASFSKPGMSEIEAIHKSVHQLLTLVINRFASGEVDLKKPLKRKFHEISALCEESVNNHRRRLSDNTATSIESSSIHQDAVRDLLQVATWLSVRNST